MMKSQKQKHGRTEKVMTDFRQFAVLCAALALLFLSGCGKAPETAWFVIYPADEYNIVNRQGFTATEFTFVEPYFDYISIEKNPLKIEGFYFNVKKLLKEYNRKFYER